MGVEMGPPRFTTPRTRGTTPTLDSTETSTHPSPSPVPSSETTPQADFVDQQFTKEEVASKVLEQYDEQITRSFYQCVMGGGGHDIHFGIYKNETDGVKESSQHTTEWMMAQMEWAKTITPGMHVLDLGSGHGGGSHAMAQKFGCKVTGYNLGPGQNSLNMERCAELGISHLVDAQVGNINNPLPQEWTNKFDAVWSCEVLCHAGDKVSLFKELVRCLKPGGVFVFSDIMGADGADEAALKGFTDRNATTFMGRPSMYIDFVKEAGFKYVTWWDGSNHLERYFRNMLSQIANNRTEMNAKGISDQYLDNWVSSLTERADIQQEKGVFAWGVFVARKPGQGEL
jgi:sarcosine/dimethylglycine N-methyltransferase|tara:strand:- start:170 stop:1195 length:1026 start_codon:yes stop_codon:yes gene_type:complete